MLGKAPPTAVAIATVQQVAKETDERVLPLLDTVALIDALTNLCQFSP